MGEFGVSEVGSFYHHFFKFHHHFFKLLSYFLQIFFTISSNFYHENFKWDF